MPPKILLKYLEKIPIGYIKQGRTNMIIARYRELTEHPVYRFNVEVIVISNGKRITIAEFNCATEEELRFATDCCDYAMKGE